MTTAAKLRTRSVKDLAAMAKKKKVAGWHMMRKDQLVSALVKQLARASDKPNGAAKKECKARLTHRLEQIKTQLAEAKDLAIRPLGGENGHSKDRLIVMVRDPYWLHAYWELSRRGIERARAAMGQHWHQCHPVLRLARSELQRHHLLGPAAASRHRDPRRREQLVHRRLRPPQELPGRNRLHGLGRPFLLSGAEQRGPHPRQRRPATPSTRTGPKWPRISIASTP